jgi:hypothetical protein
MTSIIHLNKITEALSLQSQGILAFVNPKTGETALVEEDLLAVLQDEFNEEADLGWNKEVIAEAKQIVTATDWLELPSAFDIHEWQIMKDFAWSIEQENVREDILQALSGRGAFRSFRNALDRCGLTEQWYQWRDKVFEEIAVAWLEENKIAYSREKNSP